MKKNKISVLIAISLLLSGGITKVHAQSVRLGGADRYETCTEISKSGWETSDNVVLSNGEGDENFADALSGTLLAYDLNAPMLITSSETLNSNIEGEISRLKAKNVYILGGNAVVSSDVENQLKSKGYNVVRLYGLDRYETATKIADKALQTKVSDTAYLVTGHEFQYAMLASSLAAKVNAPLLFTEGNELNETTKNFLADHPGIKNIKVLGLNSFVTDKLQSDLSNLGLKVDKIAGSDLNELQKNIIENNKGQFSDIAVANNSLFPDALSGAALACKNNALMILTDKDSIDSSLVKAINDNIKINKTFIFGEEGAVSQNVDKILSDPNYVGSNSDNTSTAVSKFEIKFANRPELMTLTEHDSLVSKNMESKAGLPTIGPLYQSNWRMQPVSINMSGNPEAVFEFGNTGSTPITITDDNLCFMYNNSGGDNVSGSKIEGGPITVQPGKIATIRMTCKTPETRSIFVNIEDVKKFYKVRLGSDIETIQDTTPLSVRTDKDLNTAAAIGTGQTVGNGKFKYQVLGIKLVENTEIGKLSKPEGGSLAIVKVRLANTSSETMNIDKFALKSNTFDDNWTVTNLKSTDWTKTDQTLLGENALPMEIKPNSIVEGYIPFVMYDSNEWISIQGHSNLGTMDLRSVETFSPWGW